MIIEWLERYTQTIQFESSIDNDDHNNNNNNNNDNDNNHYGHHLIEVIITI